MPNEYIEKIRPEVERIIAEMGVRAEHKAKMVADLRKRTTLAEYLLGFWETDVLCTQHDIVVALPRLGCHEKWEANFGSWHEDSETTKRKVRQLIGQLRVIDGLPVVSQPGSAEDKDDAGYWLARSSQEVKEYLVRRSKEIPAVMRTSIASWKAVMTTCRLTGDNYFDDVSLALEALETRALEIEEAPEPDIEAEKAPEPEIIAPVFVKKESEYMPMARRRACVCHSHND